MRVGNTTRMVAFLQELYDLCVRHKATIKNMEDMDVVFGKAPGNGHVGRKKPAGRTGKRVPLNKQFLDKRLKALSITIAGLSRTIGVTDSTIHGWRNGTSNPTEEMIHRMSSALKTKAENLIKA